MKVSQVSEKINTILEINCYWYIEGCRGGCIGILKGAEADVVYFLTCDKILGI